MASGAIGACVSGVRPGSGMCLCVHGWTSSCENLLRVVRPLEAFGRLREIAVPYTTPRVFVLRFDTAWTPLIAACVLHGLRQRDGRHVDCEVISDERDGGGENVGAADAMADTVATVPQLSALAVDAMVATKAYDAAVSRWLPPRTTAPPPQARCCVCLEDKATHAFVPCGHLCVCAHDAAVVVALGSRCPVCRASVRSTLRVWY